MTMGAIGSGTSLSVLAGSAVVAERGVPAWDRALFATINGLPGSFAPLVWGPMQAGALGAPLAVGAFFLIRREPRAAVRTVLSGALAWGIAKGAKRAVGRGRPGAHIDTTVLRVGSADHGLGYPSGHAAVAVTLVSAIPDTAHPAWRTAGALLAIAVGVARVYVGAHYPLDVIGGWALGATILDATRVAETLVDSAVATG